jgi:hypothetical protein
MADQPRDEQGRFSSQPPWSTTAPDWLGEALERLAAQKQAETRGGPEVA